jgi:hypothetical protein
MPPPAAAEVAVDQLVELPELEPPDELLLPHPAASTEMPITAVMAVPIFFLRTLSPSDLHDRVGSGREHRREVT